MRIAPVVFNNIGLSRSSATTGTYQSNSISLKAPLNADKVSFSGVAHGGSYLRKLAAYKIPDFYTGKIMLDSKTLESMQINGLFNKPISKIVKVVSNYEETLQPVEARFFTIIKNLASQKPDLHLTDVMAQLKPEHEKKLLRKQQHVFERLIMYACDMPQNQFEQFSSLMNITNKRLLNDPVILPFRPNEFQYKLKRISLEILSKNNRNEVKAIRKLMHDAKILFPNESGQDKHKYSRTYIGIQKRLEDQMKPEVLKENSRKLQILRTLFKESSLKNNKDLKKLLDDTSARIHGFPFVEQFARKSFLHEVRKIVSQLDDKDLAEKIIQAGTKLPRSVTSLSAFIVKYAEANNEKIGFQMLKGACASVDHLVPKIVGGPGRLSNFALCSAAVNTEKTNIPFDVWVRTHPQIYKNAQKYIDRMIELYNKGIFDKVGVPRSYITDLADRLLIISPKEKPIILDISALKD